uniref:histidine kinase n=1 Tax=Phenylobacterium glaciei TaxID=2803784 RepID=A0A974P3H9_9CAUL|nr:hypothetical protein JKL49_00645 [Phenylobacterium glaciei]
MSARSATTPKELAATVQGRLGALASAHQLIRPGRSGPRPPSGKPPWAN